MHKHTDLHFLPKLLLRDDFLFGPVPPRPSRWETWAESARSSGNIPLPDTTVGESSSTPTTIPEFVQSVHICCPQEKALPGQTQRRQPRLASAEITASQKQFSLCVKYTGKIIPAEWLSQHSWISYYSQAWVSRLNFKTLKEHERVNHDFISEDSPTAREYQVL